MLLLQVEVKSAHGEVVPGAKQKDQSEFGALACLAAAKQSVSEATEVLLRSKNSLLKFQVCRVRV